jgi:hypothetical protein
VGQANAKGGAIHIFNSTTNVHDCRISWNKADVKGGGIYLLQANSEIRNNIFTNNTCVSDGGAIFLENSPNVNIHDNTFLNNSAANGGAVHYQSSGGWLMNNIFRNNSATSSVAGGIYLYSSSPEIGYNVINRNSSASSNCTGIYCYNYSSPNIHHNELCFNTYTAIYCGNYSSPLIDNNTIFGNNSYAVRTVTSCNPIGHNNIVLGNAYMFSVGSGCSVTMTYSNVQSSWSGTGNLINAQPFFVNPYGEDFHLMPYSPCIDAGSPLSPLDPDSTIADMGAHYFDQNQPQGTCEITLTPFGTPIVLPPSGGTVWFGIAILNPSQYFNLYDGWYNLQQPDLQIIPLVLRTNLYLPAGGSLNRTAFLTLSSTAMPGTYTLTAYVGDHPTNIEDFDSFTFVKSATGDEAGGIGTATMSDGEITETFELKPAQVPTTTELLGHYPEPFNPTTTIQFNLAQSEWVKLEIYSVNGQKVNTLINRKLPAGIYQETFDAGDLASGIYLYTFEAGNYRSAGKMILLK